MSTFHIHIASVDDVLFSGEGEAVTVPGSEGVMTILAHHSPIVSALKEGTVIVRASGGEQHFEIKRGVLEVSNDAATILL